VFRRYQLQAPQRCPGPCRLHQRRHRLRRRRCLLRQLRLGPCLRCRWELQFRRQQSSRLRLFSGAWWKHAPQSRDRAQRRRSGLRSLRWGELRCCLRWVWWSAIRC